MADPFARRARAAARLPFRRRTVRAHVGQRLYDQLMADIATCDADLLTLAAQRRDLAQRLTSLADDCWPSLVRLQGYRPPIADDLPMPDLTPDSIPLSGETLRSVVMTLLRSYGECRLYTLHCLIVVHGFLIHSTTPVKALSDALTYEVRCGRAMRVNRGTYTVAPTFRPRAGHFGNVPLTPHTPWVTPRGDDDLPSPIAWT